MNKIIVNAAKYLVKSRGFYIEPNDTPLVSLIHQDTFAALNCLANVATDTNPDLVNTKHTSDWLHTVLPNA
jgi:hypothetical protein